MRLRTNFFDTEREAQDAQREFTCWCGASLKVHNYRGYWCVKCVKNGVHATLLSKPVEVPGE